MKKLSKLFEGILNDIAKRDLSGNKRKEDSVIDVNDLTPLEFINYLNKNYVNDQPNSKDAFYRYDNKLYISKLATYKIEEKQKCPYLYIAITSHTIKNVFIYPTNKKTSKYKNAIEDIGIEVGDNDYHYYINGLRNCSNDMVVQVLNTLIDNFDDISIKRRNEITEGILGDIAKRDLSGNKRKEETGYINSLDMEEFMDYLNDRYKRIDSSKPFYKTHTDQFCAKLNSSDDDINPPVFKIGFTSDFTTDFMRIEELKLVPFSSSESIINMLIDNGFKVETDKNYESFITSKTNKVSNDLVIDVMDTIIDNVDNLYIKRK